MIIRVEFAHGPKDFAEKPDWVPWRLLGFVQESGQLFTPKGLEGQRVWVRARSEVSALFGPRSAWVYSGSFVVPDPPLDADVAWLRHLAEFGDDGRDTDEVDKRLHEIADRIEELLIRNAGRT